MKILDFSEISFENHSISAVSAIAQTNNWSVCAPRGRILNGFLLITRGECTYSWSGAQVKLSPGSLIYLPRGSVHTVTAPEKSLDFYRISFVLSERGSSEEIVFSKTPRVITHCAPKNIFEISEELRRATLGHHTDFLTMSLICSIIDYAAKTVGQNELSGVDKAIEYVKNHYTEQIKCEIS